MAKGKTDNVMVMLDTIRFASKDNPISEIPLRVGRGNSLKNPSSDEFIEEEDNNLPRNCRWSKCLWKNINAKRY